MSRSQDSSNDLELSPGAWRFQARAGPRNAIWNVPAADGATEIAVTLGDRFPPKAIMSTRDRIAELILNGSFLFRSINDDANQVRELSRSRQIETDGTAVIAESDHVADMSPCQLQLPVLEEFSCPASWE